MGKDRKIDAYLLFVGFLFRAKQHPESGSSFSWENFISKYFILKQTATQKEKTRYVWT